MTDELTESETEVTEVIEVELPEILPPMHGWVVHQTVNHPAATAGQVIWAWCRVSLDGHGYSEMHFTEADGSTPVDPYPVRTDADGNPLDRERKVQLGPVVFKAFC